MKLTDYVVEVLYKDRNNEVQQELFEISATRPQVAYSYVCDLIKKEGGTVTHCKVDGIM